MSEVLRIKVRLEIVFLFIAVLLPEFGYTRRRAGDG
jgi:hypothetical protein